MNVNKTFRGICSVCLSAFLTLPMTSLPSVFAGISDLGDSNAVDTYNTEGDISWEVGENTGVLKISGSGEMKNYTTDNKAPWNGEADKITSIVITDGVTSIGNYAFYGLSNIEGVTIPYSVTRIGIDAFKDSGCETTKEPGVDDGVRYVGEWVTSFNSTEENKASEIEIKDGTIGTADFEASGVDVKAIVFSQGIQYIGQNFLKGSSLKSVYFKGEGENLDINEIKVKAAQGVDIYYTVVSGTNVAIEGINKTSRYHVGDRPAFDATLTDNGGTTPRLTMEEKWVNINNSEDEITKDNGKTFEDGVTYKYVIILKLNNDKFSFKKLMLIDNVRITCNEGEPLVGNFIFRDTFKALSAINSVDVPKSESFGTSCVAVGLEPKFAENVEAGANYSIDYEAWEKLNSSDDVEKRAVSGNYPSSGTEVSNLESFEQNGLYRYTVCLKPNEGYYFNPNMVTKLGSEIVNNSVVTEDKAIITSAVFELAGEHDLSKVEAKEPTCTEKGNVEYFRCEKCGKLFKSENGNPGEEISDTSSVEIDMIPHTFDESIFISDDENGHYHKCKHCDAHSETVAHNFEEEWSRDSENHYHKCKECDYKKDVAKHTFDKKVEDKKYIKDGLTCGDVLSYYKSCECGESSKGTESEETFENEEGKKVEHEFGEDGVCTICKATDYKLSAVDGNTYTETENGSLIFRANGSLDKLSSIKVDGTVLTKDKDYTVKSGSTIVELKNDYLKTLSAGEHTLTVVYEDGQCETKFNVKAISDSQDDSKTTDDTNDDNDDNDNNDSSKGNIISDVIYKTGDNAGLISLISTVLTSGLASVWFTKKRKKNR